MTVPPIEPPDPLVDGSAMAVLAAVAVMAFVMAVALIWTGGRP